MWGIQKDFDQLSYPLTALAARFAGFAKPEMDAAELLAALTKAAVELTCPDAPKWEFIAARLLNLSFTLRLEAELSRRGIHTLYDKLRYLTDEGLYGSYILEHYSRAEISEAEAFLCPERDKLFTYSGLDLLLKRYVIHTRQHVPLETPQEMFLGIALHLAMEEKTDRARLGEKVLRHAQPDGGDHGHPHPLQRTQALSPAVQLLHRHGGRTVLEGIYRSVDNFAQVSKFGGGMGLYFGKVRAAGGSIRGFEGAAGGVIRWIRLVNDTAVAVDQLGVRQGAVAVYLDAWHKDLPEFLQLRTNNGDDRMKAHDVFPAVCYPDLFWKLAKENLDAPWHLMCPHQIHREGLLPEDYGARNGKPATGTAWPTPASRSVPSP